MSTDASYLRNVNKEGLKRVIAALEQLEDKRLEASMLWNKKENCGCLLGAIYPDSPTMVSYSLVTSYCGRPEWVPEGRSALEAWGESMALSAKEAATLQAFNDSSYLSLGDRYTFVLASLKKAVSDDE